MVAKDSSERLPQGWSLKNIVLKSGRKVKYYMNSRTGQKFHSRDDLMSYVKAQNPQLDELQPTKSPIKRPSNNKQMQLMKYTSDHPEWLPHGWIMELKAGKYGRVYKYYIEPFTGCKFYSKPEVFRHIKTVKQKDSTSKHKEMPISCVPASECYVDPSTGRKFSSKPNVLQYLKSVKQKSSSSKQKEMLLSMVSTSKPEWLPHGWNVELKTLKNEPRSGKVYQCYVDHSTGRKFFSKTKVLRYLRSVKQKSSTSKQKGMLMSMVSTSKPEWLPRGWNVELKTEKSGPRSGKVCKVTTQKCTVEDLPAGWIKEIKITKNDYGVRKNPLYIDPKSGYVFRSKKDVQRYLETGDINSCACMPKKRKLEEKILPSSASKRQKLEHRRRSKRLAGDEPDMPTNSLSIVPLNFEVDKKQGQNSGSRSELANTVFTAQALPKIVRHPFSETTLAVDFNNGVLTQPEPRMELLLHSSSDANNPLLRDPLNGSQGCGTTSPARTLAEASAILPVLTLQVDMQQEKNCLENEKRQKSKIKNENNLRACTKKREFNPPCRSSKRPACFESEKKAYPVSVPDDLADEVVGKTSMSCSGIDASCHEEANGEGELPSDPSQARKKRTRFNKEQIKTLEKNFKLGNNPKPERRIQLARALGVQPRQVTVWFQNRRAKLKKEQLENDHDLLKRQFEAIQAHKQRLDAEVELALKTPSPFHGNSSHKNQPSVDAHSGFQDKLQSLKFSKSDDKRSESEFITPLGEIFSDPCLEFAFKTLTGEFPVQAASVNGPASTPAADIIVEGSRIEGKAPIGSRKSKTTRKLSLPDEALEFQPEPVACPIITSHAFKHSARLSNKTGAVQGTGLASYSSAVATETEQAYHNCVNLNNMPQNEPSNSTSENLDNHITTGEHLKVLQISNKPEQRPFVSFDSWSNPRFDSPFKALTGSTPVVDTKTVKSWFQQQVQPTQIQREGYLQQKSEISQSPRDFSSSLPDFGLPSLFQTGISVHFDSPDKRLSSQLSKPMNSHSFLFSGSLSFSSCSSIGSHPPPPPPPFVKNDQTPSCIKKESGKALKGKFLKSNYSLHG